MKKYSINVKPELKKVMSATEGTFSNEEGKKYIQEYNLAVNKINIHEYTLEVDATSKQSVVDQDVKKL